MPNDFIVSGDTHIIEPTDLFKTRLPKHLRDRALWEEEFVLDEPIVPGGHTVLWDALEETSAAVAAFLGR